MVRTLSLLSKQLIPWFDFLHYTNMFGGVIVSLSLNLSCLLIFGIYGKKRKRKESRLF